MLGSLFVGFLALVSSNYKDAALDAAFVDRKCDYDAQYNSKACRQRIQKEHLVCEGMLRVTYVAYVDGDNMPGLPWCIPWEGDRAHVFDSSNAIVWFGGNHPVNGDVCSPSSSISIFSPPPRPATP